MAPPPRRPSALEVSFPEEAAAAALEALQISRSQTNSPVSNPLKRKQGQGTAEEEQRGTKRAQRLPVAYYSPPRGYVTVETADFRAPGEDTDPHADEKPNRILYNFCIFEPAAKNKLVLLDELEAIGENQRHFAAAGIVLMDDEDDEDYGQEDGANPTEEPDGDCVRLNDVTLYPFDYFADSAVFIETSFAFYELRGPSTRYNTYFLEFETPRRLTRTVVMSAMSQRPPESVDKLCADKALSKANLRDTIPYIRQVLEESGPGQRKLQNSPLIEDLLEMSANAERRQRARPRNPKQKPGAIMGNPDLALLKPENQSPTHVTPRIAQLAMGYFEETLQVIGAQPKPRYTRAEVEAHKKSAMRFLKECIAMTRSQEKTPILVSRQHHQQHGRYAEQATIGGEVYKAGDFVCVRKGHYRGVAPPSTTEIPDNAKLADYFWFARIMYFNLDNHKAHVQWLEHGSNIILEEMAHPQELFLTLLCEEVGWIAGKVTVGYLEEPKKHDHYFIRALYDERDASFTSLDQEEMNRIFSQRPPDNCLPCWRTEVYNTDAEWSVIKETFSDQAGKANAGVGYQGHKYHPHDFFLYNAGSGPANIGYLENIQVHRRGRGMPRIHFTKVGRARDLKLMGGDPRNIYPERHLVLSNEKSTVLVNELIRPIHVYAWDFFLDPSELKRWVDYSPYNFYCSYHLPSLAEPHAESWVQRTAVPQTMNICQFCPSDMYRSELQESRFDAEQSEEDYHVLDLFGGTGAFSQGLAEGSRGCLDPTHLIEITPSAARTAQKNNKDLITYCQDANVALRYFIKSHAGHETETPRQLFDNDNKTLLPPPIAPGKMRAIIAGLPCQSHSGLNMYRKAEDHKSNLILTAASYVDFFEPDFFFLENVPGFLRYNLLAEQASRYRVEGGIEMGGIKLLLRALLDMRYQVRFSLLQAGHYGAPQNRIRFFLIAARHGLPLPDMPQPTHDFEVTNHLRMRMPYNHKPQVSPIRTTRGRAAHAHVSIEDAIGDLLPFDWKHPDPKNASTGLQNLMKERRRKGIQAYECDSEQARCGYEGVAYKHEPRTSYQRQARERATEDLQHYTRCLLPKTVERVVTIPLQSGADFRSLPDNLAEWQFSNPASAVGRNRYRGGLYGRLENSGYFPTTVTNMHPTAKQSKVLHPDCLRMVSVRELARSQGFPDWFVFVSINDNVVTLHRQIGNAVPWQVSRALGRELRAALFKAWKKKNAKKKAADQEDVEMC